MIKTTILTVTILFLGTMMLQEVYAPDHDTGNYVAIPDWVKITSGFWANGDISDTEYVNAIEYLLKERIMTVPSTVQTAEGQEITQSIEELEQRIAQIESSDEQVSIAISETLERQIEILEGGPQALRALGPAELKKLECGSQPSQQGAVQAWALCMAIKGVLDLFGEDSEEDEKIQHQIQTLGAEIKKAEVKDLDETPAIPAGATGTYVKYKKGATDNNYRLTVMCDAGDVATGGGFLPQLELGFDINYHGSMPYPTNYENNPRMNNPTGWSFMSMDSGEARVWVVCLDLTPSSLTAGTIP